LFFEVPCSARAHDSPRRAPAAVDGIADRQTAVPPFPCGPISIHLKIAPLLLTGD